MKKRHSIKILFFLIFVGFFQSVLSQPYPAFLDSSYAIAFEDEFTGSTLDQNKWLRRFGWGPNNTDSSKVLLDSSCGPPFNRWVDLAYREYNYNDTNVLKVNGGSVKLLVKKQNVTGEMWRWDTCPSAYCTYYNAPCDTSSKSCFYTVQRPFKYVSGMLNSRQLFKYGYFEIKFKLPPLPVNPSTFMGFGPNFWLYSADKSLNNYWSEIDIFEIHGYNNLLTTNIFYQNAPNKIPETQAWQYQSISDNVWHTAGALWTNTNIEFYFDGQKIREKVIPNIKADSLVRMPIIVDINASTFGWCEPFDSVNTVFPYIYEIDYVRVWQQKEACDTIKTFCSNLNPNTYKSKIYSSVSIGGAGCNDSISNTSDMAILGANYVEVKEGFSIDANSKVLLNVQPCISPSVGQKMISPNDIFPPPDSFKKRKK